LAQIAPEGGEDFSSAAAQLRTELEELDEELASRYEEHADAPFITSHAAYTYLAQRYHLRQIGIAGVDPETEPSPQRLLELERLIEDEGVSTVFFETTARGAAAWLAPRYHLRQRGIAGVDPETEPSPQRLLELERLLEDEGVSTVCFETTASPKVAQTLAENVGIEAAELDNLETQLDEQQDYPAVMRSNSRALVESWT